MSSPLSQTLLAGHMRAVEAAVGRGDMPRAAALCEAALAEGCEHPRFLTLAAYRRLHAGEPESALDFAMRAYRLAPGNIDVLNAAGECLSRAGRPTNAIAFFDKALALAPDNAVLQFNAAAAFEQINENKRACEGYERAFALDPRRADAAARLAYLSTIRGDMDKARELGLRALSLDPKLTFAGFAVALADIDQGKFAAARDRLVEVIDAAGTDAAAKAMAQSILGDALDGMGLNAEAFTAYARSGETMRELYAPVFAAGTGLARAERIAAYVARAPRESWFAAPGEAGPVRTHVFLVGFPRSGTTLLAQVAAAHPAVALLDEKQTLADSSEFLADDAGLDKLAAMRDGELVRYRRAYWERVAQFGEPGGRDVLVDKRPLDCEVLCLIAKLFPRAKIVFALRDPRDVVFSCFRRRFGMTRQMYELLTLQSTAQFYDVVMQLGDLYREKLTLPILDIRHEDFVRDFEGETRKLCAFLGVGYDPAVAGFAEHARRRNLATPSAAQVLRGLNRDGVDRWRAYREQLAPVLPLLAPWAARFGYREN